VHVSLASTVGRNSDASNGDRRASKGTNALLREEELTNDLAYDKSAKQSTTLTSRSSASRSVDGLIGTCSKTKLQSHAWWRVYLVDVYEIWAVVIASCGKWNAV